MKGWLGDDSWRLGDIEGKCTGRYRRRIGVETMQRKCVAGISGK